MFRTKFVRKSKGIFYVQNIFLQNCTFDETMWKNAVQSLRPLITIQYGACALRAG
jgi:hypothetical protein